MSFGEQFLEQPDFFPARPAGDPWGGGEVTLDLPGGAYRITGLSGGQEAVLRETYGGYVVAASGPAPDGSVEVRVFRAAEHDFRSFDLRGWTFTVDADYRESEVRLAGLRFMARLDWRPELGGSLWTDLAEGPALLGVFENFFRCLVAYAVAEEGGALFHSAAAVVDDGAILFCGPSGAGKSTLARRARAAGREVLSDDLNALAPRGGAPRVRPVPFTGELGGSGGTPRSSYAPRALLWIEKGEAPAYRPLGPASAVAYLLTSAPYVNADTFRLDRLAASLERMARTLPTGILTFPREADFEALARLVEAG